MLAHLLRTSPGVLSAVGVILGFVLIMSGVLPLAVVGAALIVLAFLVPYFRLAQRPSKDWQRPAPERNGLDEGSSVADTEGSSRDYSQWGEDHPQRVRRQAAPRKHDQGSRSSAD